MKALTTVFPIKEELIPKEILIYEIKFDMKKLAIIKGVSKEKFTKFPYDLSALIAHKLTRLIKPNIIASSGIYIVSTEKIDEEQVSKIIESDNILMYQIQDSFEGLSKPEKITESDFRWNEICKKYLIQFFKTMLFNHNYIPVQFVLQRHANTLEWYKPLDKLEAKEKQKYAIFDVSLPTKGESEYSIRRCIKFQVNKTENGKWCFKTDLTSKISSKLSLLDLLKKYLKSNNLTYEDVRDSEEIQKEIDKYFKRKLPSLRPRYQNYSETGVTQNNGYFVKFNWEHSVSTKEHFRRVEGKKTTIYDYHKYIGNKIADAEQPITVFKYYGPKTYDFPPELLEESPNFQFLKLIGASHSALEQTKPNEVERVLMILLLLEPLTNYLNTTPLIVDIDTVVNIFRIEKTVKNTRKKPLYDKHSENWNMMEIGDFRKIGIIVPSEKNITPKEESQLDDLLGEIKSTIKTILISNGQVKEDEVEQCIVQTPFSETDKLSIIFEKLQQEQCNIVLTIKTSKVDYDWEEVKHHSIDTRIINQHLILKEYVTKEDLAKRYYIRNLLYQMVFKSGGVPFYVINADGDPGYVYIGLDAVPAKDYNVGVRTGTCLMMPNGKYVYGVTNQTFDSNKSDYIPLEKLLTEDFIEKMQELKDRKQLEHLVVLRDGGYTLEHEFIKVELEAMKSVAKRLEIPLTFVTVNKGEKHRFYNFTSEKHEHINRPATTLWEELDPFGILKDPKNHSYYITKYRFEEKVKSLGINLHLKAPLYVKSPYEENSFYLLTTMPTGGTITSVNYLILYTDEDMQKLKNQLKGDLSALCKGVHESMHPVRLPAPVFYADKLAGWVAKLAKHPPKEFRDKVFFS